jgi:hypothetical protein
LLVARGHYAALWRRQSGGFRMDLPGGERGDALVAVRA